MQCVNCGKPESKHPNKVCPLGSGFHLTQQLNPHRQCRHWQGKV